MSSHISPQRVLRTPLDLVLMVAFFILATWPLVLAAAVIMSVFRTIL